MPPRPPQRTPSRERARTILLARSHKNSSKCLLNIPVKFVTCDIVTFLSNQVEKCTAYKNNSSGKLLSCGV